MPNSRRARLGGATYFFTVNTYRRQPFLIDPDVRSALRVGVARVRQTLPFAIDAWVLLPDHMHCIWSLPDGDADFSTRWRIIKTTVTHRSWRAIEQRGLVVSPPGRQGTKQVA
ncbi:MAG: transposase [Gammaproteobacteria bacterium]